MLSEVFEWFLCFSEVFFSGFICFVAGVLVVFVFFGGVFQWFCICWKCFSGFCVCRRYFCVFLFDVFECFIVCGGVT